MVEHLGIATADNHCVYRPRSSSSLWLSFLGHNSTFLSARGVSA